MVVTTADPYALLLQYTSFHSPPLYPLSQHYIGLQVWNPHLSPLPSLTLSLHLALHRRNNISTTYHPIPNVFYLLFLYATGILKDKAGVRDEHCGKGWDAEAYDTWPGECARFDAVVLNAYMECLALYQEDRRHYLR